MNDETIPLILDHWRRTTGTITRWASLHDKDTVFEVTAQHGAFVLKDVGDRSRAGRLSADLNVLRRLDTTGVPVCLPLPADCGDLIVIHGDRLHTLSPVIPVGQTRAVNWREACANVGVAIARLHAALAAYPGQIDSWRMDLRSRVLDQALPFIHAHLPATQLALLNAALAPVEPIFQTAFADLPAQYIHGDCHGGNVLLHNEEVTAFIDLDHLPFGPRVYDLVYWLADCVKGRVEQPEQLADWLDWFDAVLAGYERESRLTAHERAALWPGMLAVQLIFVEWFLEHDNDALVRRNLDGFYWIYRLRANIEAHSVADPWQNGELTP